MTVNFDMSGRIVVVTGGNGQLGRQFRQTLLDHGAMVAVLDIAEPAADAADDRLIEIQCDITERQSIVDALGRVVEQWGTPHGLINNAGLDSPPGAPAAENGRFEDYPAESWDRVMAVNAKGTFQCCQVIGGAMAAEGRGSIVNVASIYGLLSPDQGLYQYRRNGGDEFFKPVAYSASKSAIYNLTRYLATYWGPRNLRVNTVTFGGVFNSQDEDFLSGYIPKVPLGRMANETDYNGTMIYLLSDASSYMTGANLVIDGGFSAW